MAILRLPFMLFPNIRPGKFSGIIYFSVAIKAFCYMLGSPVSMVAAIGLGRWRMTADY